MGQGGAAWGDEPLGDGRPSHRHGVSGAEGEGAWGRASPSAWVSAVQCIVSSAASRAGDLREAACP